ncbi:A/G-specific adenine glycosylase [Candidatus Saccharibacteria bacterium]|nr:A/G-specific adenine glycosylase [Candidatus Saccharibacteria bacterium]
MQLNKVEIQKFQEMVWGYYREHGRELPWREEPFDAYRILVSEIMLQQTQVSRVIPKYHSFLKRFPTIDDLAKASIGDVLREWSGLGYNRRAKYLHEAAKQLLSMARTWKVEDLEACKGIGKNTAAAICVYAYNQPLVFIETNIRTVYIHHFFEEEDNISDSDLLPLLEQTIDREHPRKFMWALMDCGTHLKKTAGITASRSKHYSPQSKFEGSLRQIRGEVLRQLLGSSKTERRLVDIINDSRLKTALAQLSAEGLIIKEGSRYHL